MSSVKLSQYRSKVLCCEYVEHYSPNPGLPISWDDCRKRQRLRLSPCPCKEVLEAARKPLRETQGLFSFPWLGYRPHTEYESLRRAIFSCANASGLMFKLADTTAGRFCHLTNFDCKEGHDVPLSETDKEEARKNTSSPFDYLLGGEPVIVGLRKLTGLSASRREEPTFTEDYFPLNPNSDGLTLHCKLGNRLVRYAYPNPKLDLLQELEKGLARRVNECFAELTEWFLLPPEQVETVARQAIKRLEDLHRKSGRQPLRLELVRSLRDILMEHFPELPPTNALHYVVFLLRAADLEQGEHWAVFNKLRKEEERSPDHGLGFITEEISPNSFKTTVNERRIRLGNICQLLEQQLELRRKEMQDPKFTGCRWPLRCECPDCKRKPARRGRNSPGTP